LEVGNYISSLVAREEKNPGQFAVPLPDVATPGQWISKIRFPFCNMLTTSLYLCRLHCILHSASIAASEPAALEHAANSASHNGDHATRLPVRAPSAWSATGTPFPSFPFLHSFLCCGDASAVLSQRIVHHQPKRDAVPCWHGELHLDDVLPTTAFHQNSSLYTLHLTTKPQNLGLLLLHSPQNAPNVTCSYNFVYCNCHVQQCVFSSTTLHQEPQRYNGNLDLFSPAALGT
jgi:hypothetical protein